MSAEAGFAEPHFPTLTSPRGGNKRKRGPTDSPAGTRTSPMTRRNQYGGQTSDEIAPTAAMNNQNTHDFLQDNGAQYGLPNLAPNPNTGGHSGDSNSMDTAARALNFSMQVPQHPAQSFMEQAGAGEGDQSAYGNPEDSAPQYDAGQPAAEDGDGEEGPADMNKPAVGSEEWTRQRKDNHKEGMWIDTCSYSSRASDAFPRP